MKFATIPAVLAFAAVATCAPAFASPAPDQAATAHQDTKFLEKANQGSVDEIEIAQLVLKKSTNDDVKAFAQRMIDDHGKLLNDMKPFDNEAGLKVPEHPDAATEATKLKLDILKGAAFDKAYIKAMVDDHKKDLQEFQAEAKSTGYPAFRNAVEQGESVVREHLQMIDDLAKKNGVTPAPIPAAGN
jgi:putative membrane protein